MKTTLLIGPHGSNKNMMAATMVGKKKFKVMSRQSLDAISFFSDQAAIASTTITPDTEVLIFDEVHFPCDINRASLLKNATSIIIDSESGFNNFEITPEILFLSQNTYDEVIMAFSGKAEVAKTFNAFAEVVGHGCGLESLMNTLFEKVMGKQPAPAEPPIVEYFETSLQELNDGYECLKNNLKKRWPSLGNQQSFNDMIDTVAELKALVTLAAHNMRQLHKHFNPQKPTNASGL